MVIYYDTDQYGKMESNEGCPKIKQKNLCFVHQTSLLGINCVKAFAPKEWFNHSNGIYHPFQQKLKLARNEEFLYIVMNYIKITI